ncbi:MAG: hypothetical protein RBT45_07590, partial [Acholeplasmataceae bacterium]|nr:hypothetical protein [Acholeplasmataceae bacterium]
MNKKNNLVEIAEILVKLKEERLLNDIPENYPKGSVGIIINGDKFVVDNSVKSENISAKTDQNTFKDDSLKYNPNFYLSTYDSGEPEIIDEFHNKGRLINEAYTEISFLPKDIISQAKLDKKMGKEALKIIMPDENQISLMDFDYYDIEQPVYSLSTGSGIQTEYDEIFRCRCNLTDITGNEMVENFLIVAHKVSQKANSEYSYEVKTDSENIKKLVENIEKKAEDKNGDLRFQFPPMTNDEYERISSRVEAGIKKYFKDNRDKNYRITSVDIKAIYCLRLNKIPITVLLKKDDATIAKIDTYYSMVWSDLNVYTCPHCKSTSNQMVNNEPMKIHVCHDFS